jgi:hypothetical protein
MPVCIRQPGTRIASLSFGEGFSSVEREEVVDSMRAVISRIVHVHTAEAKPSRNMFSETWTV